MDNEAVREAAEKLAAETKPLWSSKTFWFNAIAAIAPLAWPPAAAWIAANPETYSALLGAVGVALRMVTSTAVSARPAAPTPPSVSGQ
jgi:hypothetical protein